MPLETSDIPAIADAAAKAVADRKYFPFFYFFAEVAMTALVTIAALLFVAYQLMPDLDWDALKQSLIPGGGSSTADVDVAAGSTDTAMLQEFNQRISTLDDLKDRVESAYQHMARSMDDQTLPSSDDGREFLRKVTSIKLYTDILTRRLGDESTPAGPVYNPLRVALGQFKTEYDNIQIDDFERLSEQWRREDDATERTPLFSELEQAMNTLRNLVVHTVGSIRAQRTTFAATLQHAAEEAARAAAEASGPVE